MARTLPLPLPTALLLIVAAAFLYIHAICNAVVAESILPEPESRYIYNIDGHGGHLYCINDDDGRSSSWLSACDEFMQAEISAELGQKERQGRGPSQRCCESVECVPAEVRCGALEEAYISYASGLAFVQVPWRAVGRGRGREFEDRDEGEIEAIRRASSRLLEACDLPPRVCSCLQSKQPSGTQSSYIS